jgi:hypothetical protein
MNKEAKKLLNDPEVQAIIIKIIAEIIDEIIGLLHKKRSPKPNKTEIAETIKKKINDIA